MGEVVDHCWVLSVFLCAASEAVVRLLPRIYLRKPEIVFWQDGRVFVFEDGELREDFLELAVFT